MSSVDTSTPSSSPPPAVLAPGASLITLIAYDFVNNFGRSPIRDDKIASIIEEAANHVYCPACRGAALAYIKEFPIAPVVARCDDKGFGRSYGALYEWLLAFYNRHHPDATRELDYVVDYFSPHRTSVHEEDFCLGCSAAQSSRLGVGFVYDARALERLGYRLHRAEQPPLLGDDEDYAVDDEGYVIVPPSPSPLSSDSGALATMRYDIDKFPLGVSAFLARKQEHEHDKHGVALDAHFKHEVPCYKMVPTAAASKFHLLLTEYQRLRKPYNKKATKLMSDVFVTPHFLLVPRDRVSVADFKSSFAAAASPEIWESCSSVVVRGASEVYVGGDGGSGGSDGDGVPAWPGDLDDVSDRSVRQMYSHVLASYPASSGMERLVFNDILTTIALDKSTLNALSYNQPRLRTWLGAVHAAQSRAPHGSDAFWAWAKVEASLESVLVRDDDDDGGDDANDDASDGGHLELVRYCV